jgi:hypothetical protein
VVPPSLDLLVDFLGRDGLQICLLCAGFLPLSICWWWTAGISFLLMYSPFSVFIYISRCSKYEEAILVYICAPGLYSFLQSDMALKFMVSK